MNQPTSVGLDVHARSITAASFDGTGEIRRARFPADYVAVWQWLLRLPGRVQVAYEAGPTGFGLARFLLERQVSCLVAAPSRLPRPSGDRIKTDRRDALLLAQALHAGFLTAIEIPTLEREAARDLVRARDDVRGDLMAARHRLSKLLLRHNIVYQDGRAWTKQHERWLRSISFQDLPPLQAALDSYLDTVTVTLARRNRLDAQLLRLARTSTEFTPVVRRLCCLRGVSLLTAYGLAVELGDWHRFTHSSIGAYVGLVPSESSSGGSRWQGSITKAGNQHVRRLLIEAAWHHARRYQPSKELRDRWQLAPAAAQTYGHLANQQLHRQWVAMATRKKKGSVITVAIGRQLAGCCWHLATLPE